MRMIDLLFRFLGFLSQFAWLIWPASLMGDIVLSKRFTPDTKLHRSRWALRALHSLTLAAFLMVFGIEFFWINVVNIHYHGGWEILVVGPLALYVFIRLAQRFDAQPPQVDKSGIHSTVALWLPATSAVLLLVACVNSATRSIPFLTDREPILIVIVPVLLLITVGSLSRCKVRCVHVMLASSLAAVSLLLIIAFFIAAKCRFFGFLPWRHANDDPWFYVLTGLVCFTILSITSILARKDKTNNPIQATPNDPPDD